MSPRHRLAIVLLAVLIGLPISGTICAMSCTSDAVTAATHHGSSEDAMACAQMESPSSSSAVVHMFQASADDCGTHESGIRETPTTAAARADITATAPPLVLSVIHSTLDDVRAGHSVHTGTPPSAAPPIVTSLVLRV